MKKEAFGSAGGFFFFEKMEMNIKNIFYQWGKRGARINSISPGIIVTPLALDEFNGSRGDF